MVSYNILSSYLKSLTDGWTIRWIRNWLDGHIGRATVSDSVSKPAMSSVPQRPVLGPISFHIFFKDIVGLAESKREVQC